MIYLQVINIFKVMKLRMGSMLLQIKLTALFVVFGLIIGLFSYLISTVSTAKMVVDTFVDNDTNPISKLMEKYPNDWIYDLFSEESSSSSAREALKSIVPAEFKDSIFISFYYKKKDGENWYLLKDTAVPQQSIRKVEKNSVEDLNTALKNRILELKPSFFNVFHSHVLFFNATSTGDMYDYVIKTTINSEDMIDYVLRKKREGVSYIIITLFLSLIIGTFFIRSITKPVRELSKKAYDFSEGDFTVRFETKRKDDIGDLTRSMNRVAVNISHRIKTIQTMNKIDKAVNSSLSRKELLISVADFIKEQFTNSIVIILEKIGNFYRVASSSSSEIFPVDTFIPYSRFPKSFLENDHLIFDLDTDSLMELNSRLSIEERKQQGMSLPLMQSDHIAGLLIVAMNNLTARDRDSLILLADQVSVALLSMKEDEEKQLMYKGMLQALSRSIDAKSKWTAGHSERVAFHAGNLARKIGLGAETLELINIASFLHDIGKLGISEDILDKPGRLTDEEYTIIKLHPEMGEKIVADIPNFEQVRYAIRHHHERWDGKGYPDGISKDSIPLIARIIAVADVWDAITADRPYRKGFSRKKVLEIMKSERAGHFDPSLLDIFLELI